MKSTFFYTKQGTTHSKSKMTPDFIKTAPIPKLIALLQKLDDDYYNQGKKIGTSDDLYDMIKETVKERAPDHPYFKTVGAPVNPSSSSGSKKVTLPYYMGSMDKIKSDEGALRRFVERVGPPYDFVFSDKLDGISALYVYDSNVTTAPKLYTRGNGYEGQDISWMLPYLTINMEGNNIPSLAKKTKEKIVVRGELIMTKLDFEEVKDKGANARNMVAGIVNSKSPSKDMLRRVQFIAYSVIYPQMSASMQMRWLEKNKWTAVPFRIMKNVPALSFDILSNYLTKRRDYSDFEIDGIIVAHDKYYDIVPGENPDYAFAFKTMMRENAAEVIVSGVEWGVSKHGLLKPVVLFNGVSLGGVTIRRATGFHAKYIKENLIGPGARIMITRSGDVIPYITKVLTPASDGQPMMPDVEYDWTKNDVDIVVKDKDTDPEVAMKALISFFSKVKVHGFSTSSVRKMVEAGFKKAEDIMYASREAFVNALGAANGEKVWQGMQNAREKIDCATLMDASNLFGPGFGAKKLNLILDKIPDVMNPEKTLHVSTLTNLDGVSDVTAQNFIAGRRAFLDYLADSPYFSYESLCSKTKLPQKRNNKKTKDDSDSSSYASFSDGENPTNVAKNEKNGQNGQNGRDMTGEQVVFTGFRDADLEERTQNAGGKVASSISGKVTLLIYKTYSDKSAKIKQAREKGIRIMSVDDYRTFLSV